MRKYKLYYRKLPAAMFADKVAVEKNDSQGKLIAAGEVTYGTRNLVPTNTHIKAQNEKNNFFIKLEASILKEGIRNPIVCIGVKEGLYVTYGGTRLWIAKENQLHVPCIIVDYCGDYACSAELFTEEEIRSSFKEPPSHVMLTDDKVSVWGCAHSHLEGFTEVTPPEDLFWASEKSKYEKMWNVSAYRSVSPGENLQSLQGVDSFTTKKGASLCDFGCGTGRAALNFKNKGLKVTMVDITRNCLDPLVQNELSKDFSFIETSIWALKDLKVDYGYCCDVMEHIPEEKVLDTLRAIRRSVKESVFFNISLIKDSMGSRIGETLHLTVKPIEWWLGKLLEAGFKVKGSLDNKITFNVIAGV